MLKLREVLRFAVLLQCAMVARGQEQCTCSPGSYQFKLDFSRTCPPVNITRNGGVVGTTCTIGPFGESAEAITDFVPVEVSSLVILETHDEFGVLSQETFPGVLKDGGTFDYTPRHMSSFHSDPILLQAIQLNIFAVNAMNQTLFNSYTIVFSTDCAVYPVLESGNSAGWTILIGLGAPSSKFCPGARRPTLRPSHGDTPLASLSMSMDLSFSLSLDDELVTTLFSSFLDEGPKLKEHPRKPEGQKRRAASVARKKQIAAESSVERGGRRRLRLFHIG